MDATELRRLRELPLEAVLDGFGARRDRKDPRRNWRTGDNSRITVSGARFFDHDREVGGGGAIDLALHLMGRNPRRPSAADLRAAASWLGAPQRASAAPSAEPLPASAQIGEVVPDPARIARVRWYLIERRAIPAGLVDAQIERGSIFADRQGNVVFTLRDETGRTIGYEKRGTYDKPFHGVQGEKGLFFVGARAATRAAFVESAIEALSYRALRGDALAISTTGNAIELPERMARRLRERGFRIVAAFNADRDGDRFAERFAQRLGGEVERDRPRNGKDWNEILQWQARSFTANSGAKTPGRALELTR
jgi:hypothetical protein